MTVTYQVGGGGNLDIDFTVRSSEYFIVDQHANLSPEVTRPIHTNRGKSCKTNDRNCLCHG